MQSELKLPSLTDLRVRLSPEQQSGISLVNRLWEQGTKPEYGKNSLSAARGIIEVIGFSANGYDLNLPPTVVGQPDPIDKAIGLLTGSFTHPPKPDLRYSYAKEIFALLPKTKRLTVPEEIIRRCMVDMNEIGRAKQSGQPLPKELKQRAAVSSLQMICLLGSTYDFQGQEAKFALSIANVIRNNHLGEEIGEAIQPVRLPVVSEPAVIIPLPVSDQRQASVSSPSPAILSEPSADVLPVDSESVSGEPVPEMAVRAARKRKRKPGPLNYILKAKPRVKRPPLVIPGIEGGLKRIKSSIAIKGSKLTAAADKNYRESILAIQNRVNRDRAALATRRHNLTGAANRAIATVRSTLQSSVNTASDRVIEEIGKKVIPSTIEVKKRKRGKTYTVTEPLFTLNEVGERFDPHEMRERELTAGEISLINFETEGYGQAGIMVDARDITPDHLPVVIDPRGRRLRLKRFRTKGEKGRAGNEIYSICMRFDSYGRAKYFEDDGRNNYHAKIELTFTADSTGVLQPKLKYSASDQVEINQHILGPDDHLREIADLDYGSCQERNGLLSRFKFEKRQEDDVLVHLFTGRETIDNPNLQSEDQDRLMNKILIPALPLDPTTLGMTILTDSGASVIHPVNYAFHPLLFPSAGKLSQARAELAGIHVQRDELLFDILAVKDRSGRFLLFDGSSQTAGECVEIFIVRKKAGSSKNDKILIVDRSLAEGENPAPFQSGVRAGKLKTGEELEFKNREIEKAAEARINVSANQFFEVKLGEREDDPLLTVHTPVTADEIPQASFYNAHLIAGDIEVDGKPQPIRKLMTINHDNRNDISPDVVDVIKSSRVSDLSRNPALSRDCKLALYRARGQNRIFGFAVNIDKNGKAEPARIRGEKIKGRAFIFFPSPDENNPHNYLALQLDPPAGEKYCEWDKAVVTVINPSQSGVVNRELVYISGTAKAPAYCEIALNDSLFYTPVVIAGKLRGREAVAEGVIDRQKKGQTLDLINVTSGVRQTISPAGYVVRVLDEDVQKILASQNGNKPGIFSRSQIYLVGIRRGGENKGFVDLSRDKEYLKYLRERKTENREAKELMRIAGKTMSKIFRISKEYEGMSKIIILEDHQTKRRTYYLFDQSRADFAESSFTAGVGIRIGSKEERSRIAEIRDYQDKVAAERRRSEQANRARFARKLAISLPLATMLAGVTAPLTRENVNFEVPSQPVPIINFMSYPQGPFLPVLSGSNDLYMPGSLDAFNYPSSRNLQSFGNATGGTLTGVKTAEGVVLPGGQVIMEGAGAAVSGITNLEGKSVTLFVSNPPIPYPVGGEDKNHVLQPAVYTAFDIDGNLGYRNDNNEVKLLELNGQDNKPVLDQNGNPVRFTRTTLQAGLFAGATLYQAALPNGDIIFVNPADIENIYGGIYNPIPVSTAYSKTTGKTYRYKTGEGILKPTQDLFTAQSVDQISRTIGNPNPSISFEEIIMANLFYEPSIYADKNGQIVARKDVAMSMALSDLNASIYQKEGDKPVVYRYYENGRETDRFITVFQGKMEEVARIVSPDKANDSTSNPNTVIAYKHNVRLLPPEDKLQEFRQNPNAFVEETWVLAEVLPGGIVAADYKHLIVYDPKNPGKVSGFYRYNTLPGIEGNGAVNPAGNIGYYKKYFRVEFDGIKDAYYVSEDQLNGKSVTAGGVVYGLADTLGFTDVYGSPTAYLVDDSIDNLGVRSKELHPPNIFIVKDQGRITYHFDNKYYISGQNERFSQDFDHLPSLTEMKFFLPENVSSRFVSDNFTSPENSLLTFQSWTDSFMRKLMPGVEARSNSAESFSAEKQLTEFSAYIDQAIKDAAGNQITSGPGLAESINHSLIHYGLDETYLLGNQEYQTALQAIAGSGDSLGVGDSRIRRLETAFVPYFQNDEASQSFAGDAGFAEAYSFNSNPSNLSFEARLPDGSPIEKVSVPIFEQSVPNGDGTFTIQRNPGIAMATYNSDGELLGEFNPTRILGEFPIPMGSTIKPLEYAFFKYLELQGRPILIDGRPLDLHKTPVNYAPGQYSVDGSQLPSNVVNAYPQLNSSIGDTRMTMDQALAVSANVPFQVVMRKFMEQNPGGWQEWQTFLGKMGVQMVDQQGNVLDKATPLAAIGSDLYVTDLEAWGWAMVAFTNPSRTITDPQMIYAIDQARDSLMNDSYKYLPIGPGNFRMDNKGIALLSSKVDGHEGVFGGKTGTVGGGANGTTYVLSTGFVKLPDGKFVVTVAIEAGQTIGSDGATHPTDLAQITNFSGAFGSTMVMPLVRENLTEIYRQSLVTGENTGLAQDASIVRGVDTAIQKMTDGGYETLTPDEAEQVFSSRQQSFVYDLTTTINNLLDQNMTDKNEFRTKLKQSLEKNYADIADSPEFNLVLDMFITDLNEIKGQPVQCMDFLFLVQEVFGTGENGLPHLSGQTREDDPLKTARTANDLVDTAFAVIPFAPGSDIPAETYFHNNLEIRISKLSQIHEGDFIVIQDNASGHVAYAVKMTVGKDGKPLMILAQSNKKIIGEEKISTGRPDIIAVNDQNFEQLVGKFGNVFVLRNPKFVPPQPKTSGKKLPASGPLGKLFEFPVLGMVAAAGKGKRRKGKRQKAKGNRRGKKGSVLTLDQVFNPTNVQVEPFVGSRNKILNKGKKPHGINPHGNINQRSSKPKGFSGFQPDLR